MLLLLCAIPTCKCGDVTTLPEKFDPWTPLVPELPTNYDLPFMIVPKFRWHVLSLQSHETPTVV